MLRFVSYLQPHTTVGEARIECTFDQSDLTPTRRWCKAEVTPACSCRTTMALEEARQQPMSESANGPFQVEFILFITTPKACDDNIHSLSRAFAGAQSKQCVPFHQMCHQFAVCLLGKSIDCLVHLIVLLRLDRTPAREGCH